MKNRLEIGSEFWDIPLSKNENTLFPSDTLWYLSGRSALRSIIADILRKKSAKKAALPAWCCDSMILPFIEAGIEPVFYPVYVENGCFTQDLSYACGCDILLIMEYFGYAGTVSGQGFPGIVIRDVTHSVFTTQYADADYYFGSLRKWAGFKTGGYAWGAPNHVLPPDSTYVAMRCTAMQQKADYIAGHSTSKEYLTLFNHAEEYLERCPVAGADPVDIEMARYMDVTSVKKQRRSNATVLFNFLSDIALFPTLNESDCPLFFPILVPQNRRDELRRYLIQKEIYCPVHWPLTQLHHADEQTLNIYKNELSIVCDQRYDENDMERIVKAIRSF